MHFAIFIMFILDFLKLVNFKAFKMRISLEKVFTTKKKSLKVLQKLVESWSNEGCSLQKLDKLGLEIGDNYLLYQITAAVEDTYKTVCNCQF